MKRILLIFFVILSLLVSCSTTQVKKPETQAETTPAPAVVAQTPEEDQDTAPEAASEAATEEVVPDAEEEPVVSEAEEQIVFEEEVAESEPAETEAVPAEVEEPAAEQDWSQAIDAAPEEIAEETKSEPVVAEAPEAGPTKAAEPAQETTTTQNAADSGKASFVDKLTAFIKRIGNFIANEILLSIGIFVCACGLVYLFVALIVSAKRERRSSSRGSGSRRYPSEDSEKKDPVHPDTDPESDDDAFLRSLLEDNND